MEDVVNILGMFWPFLILIAIFYFFMYRPQKKLQLERGRFLLSLKKGDHVVTSGGVHGIIKVLRDKYVELEIAPKVVIKVEKTAIHHGDVDLIDTETAKKAGAAVIGAEAENPEETDRLSNQRKTTDTETIEEVVEVDSAAEEGTEIIEEVIEVDENGNEISREKKYMFMEEPLLIYKKKELRKKMLALRRALSTDETDKMAMCLRANIVSLPQYKQANRIMAF